MWVQCAGNGTLPVERENSEGHNPMSAVDAKSVHWDSKGANRHEGTQTLKAEQRQGGNLPDQWTFESDVC